MDYKIRFHRAEATVSDVVTQAERELANRAKSNQSTVANMSGELNQLRSEMGAFVQAHRQQNEIVSRLEKANLELRNRLAEDAAYTPTLTGVASPTVQPIHTPPGLGQGGGGPPDGDVTRPESDGDDEPDGWMMTTARRRNIIRRRKRKETH